MLIILLDFNKEDILALLWNPFAKGGEIYTFTMRTEMHDHIF